MHHGKKRQYVYIVIVRENPRTLEPCFTEHVPSNDGDTALKKYAKTLGLSDEEIAVAKSSGLISTLLYGNKNFKEIREAQKLVSKRYLAGETAGWRERLLSVLRSGAKERTQPELSPNRPKKEPELERPRQKFSVKAPIKSVENKTEKDLSDFAKDLLHHLKLEHVKNDDYNK